LRIRPRHRSEPCDKGARLGAPGSPSHPGLRGAGIGRAFFIEHVPAIYGNNFAESGGLIFYGADFAETFRLGADYIDRVLKGAKPGELPIQLPTRFALSINLKTAKALGLDVPLSLQQRADEVIE